MKNIVSPQRGRRSLSTAEKDSSTWPLVDKSAIGDQDRAELFERRFQAISGYLRDERLCDLQAKWHLAPAEIYRLFRRATTLHPDGRPWGFRALLPGVHVVPYMRLASSSKADKPGIGYSGMLSRLFRLYPQVHKRVLDTYLKVRPGPHMKRLPIGRIFEVFIKACREAGIAANDYPFTVRNLGRTALRLYLRTLYRSEWKAVVRAHGDEHAVRSLALGLGGQRLPVMVLLPYQRVLFDGHRIDAVFTVQLPHPEGGFIDVVASRPWLLLIVDVATRAVLGWTLSLNEEYNREDVLKCVRNAVACVTPPVLSTPGVAFARDGGMPAWIVPEARWAVWAELVYDNGKANVSEWVRHQIVSVLGGAVHPGPVATPEHQAIIERLFETLEAQSGHLLPNTTGSSPQDARRQNPEGEARRFCIRIQHLEELLAVVIANYNGTPHESLGFRSPLEQLAFLLQQQQVVVRHVLPADRPKLELLTMKVTVIVRGNVRKGRRPYIQFQRERYSSGVLERLPHLIGKQIEIAVNTEDLSTLRAFLLNGEELGILDALGKWRQSKHSLQIRRATNRLYNRKILHEADNPNAVHEYLEYLRDQAPANKKAASAFERVVRETGVRPETPVPSTETDDDTPASESSSHRDSPAKRSVLLY